MEDRYFLEKMEIFRMPLAEGNNTVVPLPIYATEEAACMDFYSANIEDVIIPAGEQAMVGLGIKVAIAKGYELTLRPRSGLANKHMVSITNSPGTIDSDYRGEVKVIIINLGKKPFVVEPFMRVCQGKIERALQYSYKEVYSDEELGHTPRGEGGFNSTGTK